MYIPSLIFLAVIAMSSATPTPDEPITIGDPYSIKPYESNRDLFRDAGLVTGTRSCGGAGRSLRFRFEPCVTGNPPPCIVSHNRNYRAEFVFIPNENIDNIGLRASILTLDGKLTQFESIVKDANLVAGKEYALTNDVAATKELIGKHYVGQMEVFREKDRVVEVCAQADFFGV